MESSVFHTLVVLALIGLIDAISYMAVAPSLIFYVEQLGGSKTQYGIIMSIFSFTSFCFKPIYGVWVDRSGNKYRMPYVISFMLAIMGNLLYFGAVLLPSSIAVWSLLVARALAGGGAANNTLGYSFIATAIPHDQQTTINVVLSMTRILGMSLGPFVNYGISEIDTAITIFGLTIPMTPTNSVGLVVAIGNIFVLCVVVLCLQEPPSKSSSSSKTNPLLSDTGTDGGGDGTQIQPQQQSRFQVIKSVISDSEIMLPIWIILVANANFQLIETAFPPASAHALGWGPVQTSAVLGANSLLMFGWMSVVMIISMKKLVEDTVMVAIGNMFWIVAGILMYIFWQEGSEAWKFVTPIVLGVSGFPFIAASNRSNYTKAVAAVAALETSQSVMQSLISMAASIAGFITPTLVAAFVIRSPDDVDSSDDKHELTPLALYIPIVSGSCVFGLWRSYLRQRRLREKLEQEEEDEEKDAEVPSATSETTGLLPRPSGGTGAGGRGDRRSRKSSVVELNQAFSKQTEVSRRSQVEVMGVISCPFESQVEKHDRDEMWKQRQELYKLSTLDDDELDALALEEE